jgi:hypothetical protein
MSDSEKGAAINHREEADMAPKQGVEVDTVHQDEAMKVLGAYAGDEAWTEAEEKKLRRKIDWKLMPVLCATCKLHDRRAGVHANDVQTDCSTTTRLCYLKLYVSHLRASSRC